VVDKVALGQVISEYFGFSCKFSFQRLLHNYHLSSVAGTIGKLGADVPSGLSLTPPQLPELLASYNKGFSADLQKHKRIETSEMILWDEVVDWEKNGN
jgi:hypothetical protein